MIAATKLWIIYTRVSTEDQAQLGASLEAQEAACRGLLTAHGHGPIELVCDGGASGKSLDRPAFGSLLRRIERCEIAGIVVFGIDRLTRRNIDLLHLIEIFDRNKIELISVRERVDTSGPMGRFTLSLLGSVAQLEREMIAGRVKSAMDHRKTQGAYLGRPPTGCVTVRNSANIPRLAVCPKHGAAVMPIWKMAAEGATLLAIAAYLDEKNVPRLTAKLWSKTAVRSVIGTESVIGLLTDAATWQRAQTALGSRAMRRRELKDAPKANPATMGVWSLARLCWCADCGSAMVVARSNGRGGKGYHYLRCSGRIKKGRSYCAAPDLPHDAVETAVIDGLNKEAARGRIEAAFGEWLTARRASVAKESGKLSDLTHERDRLRGRRDRVLDVVEEGGGAGRSARERLAELQRQIETLDGQLLGIEAATSILARDQAAAGEATAVISKGLAQLPQASKEDRAGVMAGIVERVTLSREYAEVALAVPGADSVVLHDRTGWLPQVDAVQYPTIGLILAWKRQGKRCIAVASSGTGDP